MHSIPLSNSQPNGNVRWVLAVWCYIFKTKRVLTVKLVGSVAVVVPERLSCSDFTERTWSYRQEGRKSHGCLVPSLVCWWDDDGWWQLMADGWLWCWQSTCVSVGCVLRAMGGVSSEVSADGWCQHLSHFFSGTYPQKNAQEASRKSKERSRSERTLAKLLSHQRTQLNHAMTSRTWITTFKSDRDVIVMMFSWCYSRHYNQIPQKNTQEAPRLQEVIEGTLANLLSHRKTRLNHDDVAIARNPFNSDRDIIVIVFSWCFLRHYDQETSVQNKRRQASWFFRSPLM